MVASLTPLLVNTKAGWRLFIRLKRVVKEQKIRLSLALKFLFRFELRINTLSSSLTLSSLPNLYFVICYTYVGTSIVHLSLGSHDVMLIGIF